MPFAAATTRAWPRALALLDGDKVEEVEDPRFRSVEAIV